jgi:hypothetical protein
MLPDNKISKGGLIGAAIGLIASIFTHKQNDSTGKKVIKSGAMGTAGYFIGNYAEKKIKERKR